MGWAMRQKLSAEFVAQPLALIRIKAQMAQSFFRPANFFCHETQIVMPCFSASRSLRRGADKPEGDEQQNCEQPKSRSAKKPAIRAHFKFGLRCLVGHEINQGRTDQSRHRADGLSV